MERAGVHVQERLQNPLFFKKIRTMPSWNWMFHDPLHQLQACSQGCGGPNLAGRERCCGYSEERDALLTMNLLALLWFPLLVLPFICFWNMNLESLCNCFSFLPFFFCSGKYSFLNKSQVADFVSYLYPKKKKKKKWMTRLIKMGEYIYMCLRIKTYTNTPSYGFCSLSTT